MELSDLTNKKHQKLIQIFKDMESAIVAYSGGIDSSLLLKIGTDTLRNNCIGVIAISPSLASKEYEEAMQQAKQMSANLKTIDTEEMNNPLYIINNQDRCYFCKTELFEKLNQLAADLDVHFIVEGSNFDDLSDFRPGRKAASEKYIRSPLVEAKLTKNEIRELAKFLGISSWNKPSQPCLSSRVAYGIPLSENILNKIARAEQFLKNLNFKIVRVRYFEDRVSVEVGKDEVKRLLSIEIQNRVKSEFKNIGFKKIYFDPDGYQSGKLNNIDMAS